MYLLQVQFAEWSGDEPRGWQEISLAGVGVDGRAEVRAMVVQIRICENHQNGKDTHLRGVQIFAEDQRVGPDRAFHEMMERKAGVGRRDRTSEMVGLMEADWMREPEIR